MELIHTLALTVMLAPLLGGLIAGLLGKKIGRHGAHSITILGMLISFGSALYLAKLMVFNALPAYSATLYTWGVAGNFQFNVGILIDRLSATMMISVTFVSLFVHIYSVGYMRDDPGYQRFFSYMSLFTFFMLVLVAANNFLLLFFGWEGVGLISYLLIGFWFNRESAANAGFKAFIVNRVGDFGFLLAIAAILDYCGSVDYAQVFAKLPTLMDTTLHLLPNTSVSIITVICLLLFVGAMGKSAQMPLHIWLPESMEGPTPISALIHAATMVTAGVYMLARMSPLFELSQVALSTVLIVGATGALFLGIVGIVQHDIKRVVAYSTLSQLGYMVAACGASAFSAGIFHLFTHAAFKALLFLGAGSIIVAMHHEQDLRKMGGLRKYMPITYATFLIGALALSAVPPFAGFYSKDAIIEAVQHATIPGASYAYICLLLGTFVTGLYTFRAFFLAFHTQERFDAKMRAHLHESPLSITVPLIVLAIASIFIGAALVYPMLYAPQPMLGNAVQVASQYNVLAEMVNNFPGVIGSIWQALLTLPVWLGIAGIFLAWIMYVKYPQLPQWVKEHSMWLYKVLIHKYGFDDFNNWFFVRGTRRLSAFFYRVADVKIIDKGFVDGSGHVIVKFAQWVRRLQTGYLYHYALAMIIGAFVFLCWMILT